MAYAHGAIFFDATQESAKEALRRNLREMPPPYEIHIRTRPEGRVYTYDPYNRSMVDYARLKAEVERGLKLLQRERLDFLNLGVIRSVLDHDPEFLEKLGRNIAALRREGLIRFACADTFSGEYTFLNLNDALFSATRPWSNGCFYDGESRLHRPRLLLSTTLPLG